MDRVVSTTIVAHAGAPVRTSVGSAALDAVGISYRYGSGDDGVLALDDVSLTVQAGELHALLGPNGSGKTTLFKIASTLVRPERGKLSIGGCDVTRDPSGVRQRLGVVFQSVALDEQLTLAENLRTQAALYGMNRTQARERADALTQALDLRAYSDRRVSTLSGGERRRGDLARGLLHRPALLLLDEPTTALDPSARRLFLDLLADIRREESTAILMATHLLEEADDAEHVTILDRGRVAATGTPDHLRDALGTSVLWITPSPESANFFTTDTLGVESSQLHYANGKIGIGHPEPARLLARLAQAHPNAIAEAMLRRPTLEDAFLAATGNALHSPTS